jgi:agmatine deiminase
MNTLRLPAEWEEQDGVLMAWPHEATDWRAYLAHSRDTFAQIVSHASRHARVALVTPTPDETRRTLAATETRMDRVTLYSLPTNDTWARDFGPITVFENSHPVLLDFQFNGWGGKFPAELDNRLTQRLKDHGAFGGTRLRTFHLELEGGSIESDGHGTILTTVSCNANPNRNAHFAPGDMDQALTRFLGASRVLWLKHGYLAGDDTDGHIDMLARFAPRDTLVYQSCDRPEDEHFEALRAMAAELAEFRTAAGAPYRLLPLPWPEARHDADGHRLPASYANFLVLNGAVLAPVYGDPRDALALDTLRKAFPGRHVVGIDCSALIRQHGSLHCVTMQLPKGVWP